VVAAKGPSTVMPKGWDSMGIRSPKKNGGFVEKKFDNSACGHQPRHLIKKFGGQGKGRKKRQGEVHGKNGLRTGNRVSR